MTFVTYQPRKTKYRAGRWTRAAIWFGVSVVTSVLIWAIAPTTHAQTPETPPAETQTDDPSLTAPSLNLELPDFRDLLPSETAGVATESVYLDGNQLFVVAALEIDDSNGSETGSSALDARVNSIETQLRQIVNANFNPATLQLTSEYIEAEDVFVINASYGLGENETAEDYLLTVNALDAQANGVDNLETWTNELTERIEEALLRAEQERRTDSLRQQVTIASGILLVMIALSFALSIFQQRAKQKHRFIAARRDADAQEMSAAADTANPTEMTTALLQRQMHNRQQHNLNEIQRRLLQLGQTLIWGGGTLIILGLFPYTRWVQPLILDWNWIKFPLYIILTLFGTYVAIRASDVLIDRFFLVLQSGTSFGAEASQRLALRFSTFSRVAKSIIAVLLVGSGIITSLAVVGIEVAPLLAGAGIIGLGISFASQSLIKDIINGFLILFEDQYGVGDVIIVGDVAGLVENMNLRITQLRNEEGRLITIPNSEIRIVQNLSKEWSRVDLTITIANNANLDQALKVIDDVAQTMSHDRHWRSLILESPLLLGVDKLDHIGAMIRLWIKTQPLKQWDVAREYRRRLKLALDEAGIAIGVPQQSLVFKSDLRLAGELAEGLNDDEDGKEANGGFTHTESRSSESTNPFHLDN
ncbi:MAG: mechanosensitive ion channel family protein [Leptolyngbyaceae cyanobacterium SM1_4_3]|nr:mechanosensitive ion channel family protein [Leptolyngbyaceae cyanobacterium SM1_4_3]